MEDASLLAHRGQCARLDALVSTIVDAQQSMRGCHSGGCSVWGRAGRGRFILQLGHERLRPHSWTPFLDPILGVRAHASRARACMSRRPSDAGCIARGVNVARSCAVVNPSLSLVKTTTVVFGTCGGLELRHWPVCHCVCREENSRFPRRRPGLHTQVTATDR